MYKETYPLGIFSSSFSYFFSLHFPSFFFLWMYFFSASILSLSPLILYSSHHLTLSFISLVASRQPFVNFLSYFKLENWQVKNGIRLSVHFVCSSSRSEVYAFINFFSTTKYIFFLSTLSTFSSPIPISSTLFFEKGPYKKFFDFSRAMVAKKKKKKWRKVERREKSREKSTRKNNRYFYFASVRFLRKIIKFDKINRILPLAYSERM